MKALLLSIKPEHAIKILNGEKTLELRKSVPKGYKGWVYVYVTKGKPYLWSYGRIKENSNWEWETIYQLTQPYHARFSDALNGTIPFRFWFDEYDKYNPLYFENTGIKELNYLVDGEQRDKMCLEDEEINNYGKGKDLYAWHIKNLDIFSEPMKLGEFTTTQIPNNAIIEKSSEGMPYFYIKERRSWHMYFSYLTKAPQSYMYVYVKEELK